MKKKLPKSGEIYAYYIEELEKYGAFQIIRVDNNSVCYVSLDCLTGHLPQKKEVLGWKPLYLDSFRHHHSMDTGMIELTPLPPSYQCLGEFPLVTKKAARPSAGDGLTLQPMYQKFAGNHLMKKLQRHIKNT